MNEEGCADRHNRIMQTSVEKPEVHGRTLNLIDDILTSNGKARADHDRDLMETLKRSSVQSGLTLSVSQEEIS